MPAPDNQAIPLALLPVASRRLIRSVDALPDTAYAEPSGLPGWTRAHVLAHVALNAGALTAVLTGVAEGTAVPMYPSQDARDGDIAELATQDASSIRDRLLGASTQLQQAVAAVPDDGWATVIERVPGSGRTFVASEIPGMRLIELEVHHADLAVGYGPAEWSQDFAAFLLDAMSGRDDGPFHARATDLGRTWSFGVGGPTVSGSGADLGWWLTGRGAGAGLTSDSGALPQIRTW